MFSNLHPSPIDSRHAASRWAVPLAQCPFIDPVGAAPPGGLAQMRLPVSTTRTDAAAHAAHPLDAYLRSGGLASGDQVIAMLRRHTSQPLSMLARWIVERRVLSFCLNGDHVMPMFQFNRVDMRVHFGIWEILAEFDGVFDNRECATWFAVGNSWLASEAPMEVIVRDPQAVLQAARADRFIARG